MAGKRQLQLSSSSDLENPSAKRQTKTTRRTAIQEDTLRGEPDPSKDKDDDDIEEDELDKDDNQDKDKGKDNDSVIVTTLMTILSQMSNVKHNTVINISRRKHMGEPMRSLPLSKLAPMFGL